MNEEPLQVSVNGCIQALCEGCTLADLVDRLGHAPGSFATAVNGEFVARGRRAAWVLRDGDDVHCFQAIVGG
jgi:sulfur carrier protein